LVKFAEKRLKNGESPEWVFGCTFEKFAETLAHYGSRWSKLLDPASESVYYYDAATFQSQWDRPDTYDELPDDERKSDQARDLILQFYKMYNPTKTGDINDIIAAYKGKYTELFISLATKYEVEDLSMFAGVNFD
jgi:hypothetical protein